MKAIFQHKFEIEEERIENNRAKLIVGLEYTIYCLVIQDSVLCFVICPTDDFCPWIVPAYCFAKPSGALIGSTHVTTHIGANSREVIIWGLDDRSSKCFYDRVLDKDGEFLDSWRTYKLYVDAYYNYQRLAGLPRP